LALFVARGHRTAVPRRSLGRPVCHGRTRLARVRIRPVPNPLWRAAIHACTI